MIDRRIPPCYDCGAWDDEREGCTMAAPDRQYACPLEEERATEPKTGRWIFEKGDGVTCVDGYICSACGESFHTKVPYWSEFKFCPCCGARMEETE